ncbi:MULTISPECIES: hypothetical protein [Bacillus cereus group]|uniref:hypothetical protein n=1 Tax=Bacillus cereus group TaxID=86661 RepID=UPI0016434266|nr:hypothetical protein [Bacillus mycoides]
MDVEISEMLKILNDYEGNEKEIFELIQAEAMVKCKQCEEMIEAFYFVVPCIRNFSG